MLNDYFQIYFVIPNTTRSISNLIKHNLLGNSNKSQEAVVKIEQ